MLRLLITPKPWEWITLASVGPERRLRHLGYLSTLLAFVLTPLLSYDVLNYSN